MSAYDDPAWQDLQAHHEKIMNQMTEFSNALEAITQDYTTLKNSATMEQLKEMPVLRRSLRFDVISAHYENTAAKSYVQAVDDKVKAVKAMQESGSTVAIPYNEIYRNLDKVNFHFFCLNRALTEFKKTLAQFRRELRRELRR